MRIVNRDFLYAVLPAANIMLLLSSLVLCAYWVYRIISPYTVVAVPVSKKADAAVILSPQMSLPMPVYDADIFKRSIFLGTSSKKNVSQEKRALIFVGASIGRKNLAVIRDTRANKDFYCTVGDKIGEFKVTAITKDKIILESDGQPVEITR